MQKLVAGLARTLRRLALLALLGAVPLHAAEKLPFFIEVRSNQVIDAQVAEELGARAGVVVVRANPSVQAAGYAYPEIIARIKSRVPDAPVLSYAWISRYREKGRIEAYLFRGLDLSAPLARTENKREQTLQYLDVTNPAVRSSIAARLAEERKRLGVDGFAVDGAHRTPSIRPKPLANLCDRRSGFCDLYGKSMDDIMSALNQALGERGTLLYNGLWNLEPGMLADQARLLQHADSTSVEYFGLVPNERRSGFKENILPYLDVLARLPKDKPVYFYGRGPWHYTDYAADYHWQRYLYASFLLGRRPQDLYKYHATFQVPATRGRTGGLDLYADWNIELGAALGPYRVAGGLYQRDFAGGRVVVAPDDGAGGTVRLATTQYDPDGEPVSGAVQLSPGSALILLNKREQAAAAPPSWHLDAKKIAGWGWAHMQLADASGAERLRLGPLPAETAGDHDLLLDRERSLAPYERLTVNAALTDPRSAVLAVAEVDDPRGEHMWVAIEVSAARAGASDAPVRESVAFRSFPLKSERWPRLRHDYEAGRPIVLDGPAVLGTTSYRFRRWSHLRFVGPVELSGVSLDRRSKLLKASGVQPRQPEPDAAKSPPRSERAPTPLERSFTAIDTNRDDALSREELERTTELPAIRKNFSQIDADGDGKLTIEEIRAWGKARRMKK